MTDFRILGPIEAAGGGQAVALGGRRQLKLFAFLVLNANRAVSSDALIEAVWGPLRPGTADNRLQMAIARLRKAVAVADGGGNSRLRTVGGGYLLSLHPGELDAEVFQALLQAGRRALEGREPASAVKSLDRALALWRGPPLAEVAFEDFAQPEIRRLEELRLDALETRAEARLQLGSDDELIAELENLLSEQPSRERVAGQLMLALYRCGRQAQALEIYQRTRAYLGRELGLEPGPSLQALQDQILRHSLALEPSSAAIGSAWSIDAERRRPRQERLVEPPVAPTPTIGRQREIEAVCELLESREAQLVTLTGTGGVGKTRVALAVAHTLQMTIPDGVGWAELAGVARAEDVTTAITQALGITPAPDERVSDALRRGLAGKRLLLVLDNFEHVLDAAVQVADMLASSPGLSVLATSREPLDLSAEHRIQIAPLTVPRSSADVTVAELELTDGSALFLAAVRRRDKRFQATPDNAATIAQICARLEGLPLALELAAARAEALGVRALSTRLDEAVSDLGAGPRDAPARQQTLRATVEWSYRLLTGEEARAFRQFAVFAGGAPLEAATSVTATTAETLEALTAKNLINHNSQPDGSGRLVMLETIREYAVELLGQDPNQERLRQRHAKWFLEFAKRVDEHLRSARQSAWLPRLRVETDNLRAVLAWSLESDIDAGVDLIPTLQQPWLMQGQTQELITWLEHALTNPAMTGPRTRAIALREYGLALDQVGAYQRAGEALQESLELFRELGDRKCEADVLLGLSMVAHDQGSLEEALARAWPALASFRELGERWWTARAQQLIGEFLLDLGDFQRAEATLEDALSIFNDLGDQLSIHKTAHDLGDLALDQNEAARAGILYRQALTPATEIGNQRGQYFCAAGLACVAGLSGDPYGAGRLWAAAELAEERHRTPMHRRERKRYLRILDPLSDDPRFQQGRLAGRNSPVDELLRDLIDTVPR